MGFVGAAASDDCHRRAILCCAKAAVGRRYEAFGFAVQTQRLRAREAGADMATETIVRRVGRVCAVMMVMRELQQS